MSIRSKLFVAFALLIAMLASQCYYTYLSSTKTQDGYHEMMGDGNFRLSLRTMQYLLTGMSNDERAYLLNGDPQYATEMADKDKAFRAELNNNSLDSTKDDSDKSAITEISTNYISFYNVSQQVIALVKAGKVKEAQATHFDQERTIRKQLDASLAALNLKLETEVKADLVVRSKEGDNLVFSLLLAFLICTAVAIVVGVALGRMITRPIGRMNVQLKGIAEGNGDLSQVIEIRSKDEIGQMAASFNRMVLNLRSILAQARDTAIQVAASSEQLTASAEQTTRATEHIVAATQNIATSSEMEQQQMEETVQSIQSMSDSISNVSKGNEEVLRLSQLASQAASTGNTAAADVLRQMEAVHVTVDQTAAVIESLGNRSIQISNISAAITDLANRTNILSLNAGIEAARAGEHGRGFAVVAQEIRKLAEQSRLSAQQIAELIESIVAETGKAVTSMRNGTEKVGVGLTRAREVNEVFRQIEGNVSAVGVQANLTSATTRELAESSRSIVMSVEMVAQASEHIAASCQSNSAATEEQLATMEEITSSSIALSRMAEDLHNVLSKFKLA